MFPARYSCTKVIITFLIFKPSRPHLPFSSRCISSGNSTVMRAIGPVGMLGVMVSVTHFSGSTGGFVAVPALGFFWLWVHFHHGTRARHAFFGWRSPVFPF